MGNRANIVIVEDGDWRLYYSHWAGCRMLDALLGGPDLALRHLDRRTVESHQAGHGGVQ
ncbi:hypothetical protein [Mycobacterium bourgelatii]|uniref:hypothetical protein n=1 Tax=Mycobacterium bourgelatii TaxID=1273442 RepID=UPI0013D83AD2|nr:hypothetical protein [Mycobacterium bourgelatii]MCV6974039.1 hypothetical protein [Mycobacterium bourgelatii]